jgi:hypothetical protein
MGQKRKVLQYKDGEIKAIFESASKAARVTGLAQPSINWVCRNKLNSCGGFTWKYLEDLDMEGEFWLQHPTLDIKVSSVGRIENRFGSRSFGTRTKRGYYQYYDSKKRQHRVHRLVAQTFCHGKDHQNQVNHIDHDKGNNKMENLEWCTPQENTAAYYIFKNHN